MPLVEKGMSWMMLRKYYNFQHLINNLDLSSYAANHQSSQTGDKYTYDLCGVINYNESITKGHYTAYCLNAFSGKWYELDDVT